MGDIQLEKEQRQRRNHSFRRQRQTNYLLDHLCEALKSILCETCEKVLSGSENENVCPLIEARDSHNKLKTPSPRLATLINNIEEIIISTLDENEIGSEIFFEIMYLIEDRMVLPKVGCEDHSEILTKRIIYFYVSMRMHFICKLISDDISKKEKIRNLKKQAKLC